VTPIERAQAGFAKVYGEEPAGVVFAPGRVNLIGEHVDYNDGLVLPMPIGPGTAVAWARASGEQIEAAALDQDGARDIFAIGAAEPHQPPDWRSYLRGMAACLADRGFAGSGARLAIAGSVPRGSGLSSSASLCIAVGRALAAARGEAPPPPRELAVAAQAAEHSWAGVHCGIMDQMAVAAGEPGHALLLDCRSLATRQVPLPPDWAVLIVDSGVSRGLVDGEYNQRRRACEAGAAALNVASLRDATLGQVEQAKLDPVVRRRARHVITEIARTAEAVTAIERGDLACLGDLLRASHASLRDDFEVSAAPVDALVACLNAAIGDAGGARMTGGGFGGAAVAVVERAAIERVSEAARQGYRTPAGLAPLVLTV
jgi:galactokinase